MNVQWNLNLWIQITIFKIRLSLSINLIMEHYSTRRYPWVRYAFTWFMEVYNCIGIIDHHYCMYPHALTGFNHYYHFWYAVCFTMTPGVYPYTDNAVIGAYLWEMTKWNVGYKTSSVPSEVKPHDTMKWMSPTTTSWPEWASHIYGV